MAMVRMDLDAASAAISACQSTETELTSVRTSLVQQANELLGTWNGNSKGQFESTLSEYTARAQKLEGMLQELRNRLTAERSEVEGTFSSYA